jgi:putative Mg2+ transporter-C (MgtC) family protein
MQGDRLDLLSPADVDAVLRLVLALVCGICIGLNRDLHHKPAGFRTFGLVCVGSALITLVAARSAGPDVGAVGRVMQGVVTGIGFVGAGMIFHRDPGHRVTGLTTAAAIWFAAALGMACALAQYRLAIAGLVIAMFILIVGGPVERRIEKLLQEKPPPSP